MRKILFLIYIFILSLTSMAISGQVIDVADGDTLVIRSGSKKIRVRMYGIDAPELKQRYGEISKKYLEESYLHYTLFFSIFLLCFFIKKLHPLSQLLRL